MKREATNLEKNILQKKKKSRSVLKSRLYRELQNTGEKDEQPSEWNGQKIEIGTREERPTDNLVRSRAMQHWTTMRCYFTSNRLAKIKKIIANIEHYYEPRYCSKYLHEFSFNFHRTLRILPSSAFYTIKRGKQRILKNSSTMNSW